MQSRRVHDIRKCCQYCSLGNGFFHISSNALFVRRKKMSTFLQDPENLLFEAIFNGDLHRVVQLINSGINRNAVLHNPAKWEGATVLGTAACEGHLDIVKFLIDSGTSVNVTDPCLGRNALHWAARTSNPSIAEYLLDNGAHVDHTDKDSVTPLIRATIQRNAAVVKILVELGADVNFVDRFKASALHYASIYGDSEIVSALICAGCIDNRSIMFGRGTPMENLMSHGDFGNCSLLIEAGYSLENEKWMESATTEAVTDNRIKFVLNKKRDSLTLKIICRTLIRKRMSGSFLQKKCGSLSLPASLKEYISLT